MKQNAVLMWVLVATFVLGGVFVFAGWVIPGVVLLVLALLAVWRLDK